MDYRALNPSNGYVHHLYGLAGAIHKHLGSHPRSKGHGSNYIWSNVLQIEDGKVKPDNDLYHIQVLGFAVWSGYGARVYALKLCQQWSYQTEDMPCPKPVRP